MTSLLLYNKLSRFLQQNRQKLELKSVVTFSAEYISLMVDTDRSTASRLSCFILIYYIYLITFMLRLLITAFLLNCQDFKPLVERYTSADPFIGFLIHLNILDRYIVLVLWPIWFLLLYLDYIVHFSRGAHCYYLVYDLIVENKINFFALNPKVSWTKMALQLYSLWVHSEQLTVTSHRLPSVMPIEASIRRRAALLSLTFDLLLASNFYFFAVFFLLVNLYLYPILIWPVYPLSKGLSILLEVILLEYVTWHSSKISFFFGHIFNLLIYVCTQQQMMVVKRCRQLLAEQKTKLANASSRDLRGSQRQLATFLQVVFLPLHRRLLSDLGQTNLEFVSTYYLFSSVCLFGFNVYSLCMLLLKEMPPSLKFQFFAFVFLEDFIAFLAIMPMITMERAMHSAGRHLERSQAYLGSSSASVRLKLKLGEISKLKFAFTVGSFDMAPVTSKSILKVGNKGN